MNPQRIIEITADYYHVSLENIASICRAGEIIKAKHVSIYLINSYFGLTLNQIGRMFAGRNGAMDHATVLHAVNSIKDQQIIYLQLRREISEIRFKIDMETEKDDHLIEYETSEVFQENDFFTN